ncbi:GNAT family N-acetyltransferase [Bacillus sp. 3103sda1]|uniref:GNAT family N-acetyltransferase n=1 Tax=Bacillus sp. 3103sda1 TaxID=2953808 RepID=UPI00209D06AD|nr:GNAT family N-acetyltransferase [Bacillus sp. 3103sda1]MCP1123616.1 GNAT family N-acetyltransferase [Bacillus sp. 3103sda1]
MEIRSANREDVRAILHIYNDAIVHTTATFDLQEKSLAEMNMWFDTHNEMYPIIVAEEDGIVLGYCSLSPFREKEAYKQTVEISVYVEKQARGKGIAKKLIERVLQLAEELRHHTIIAGITKGNDISVKLHEQMGFTYVGCFREVGYKFNEWQDVLFYQYIIK